jgi:hypothetical protein
MRSAARLFLAAAIVAVALVPVQASAAASTCGVRALSQPFLPWLDSRHYFLLPGGDLESTTGWTFSGGARLVTGNEPFYAHRATDKSSLLLPSGARARSAATCVDSDEPSMGFFVRSTGSPLALLAVEARIRTTVLGLTTETTLPLGSVLGTQQAWQPSLSVFFKLSVNQVLGGTTTVDFRFTALGGSWQVDDVYVDPFKDR